MSAIIDKVRGLCRLHAGWFAVLAAVGLALLGVASISMVEPGFGRNQMRWVPLGLVAMLLCALPRPRLLGTLAVPMMAVSVGLLIFVILPFVPRSIVPVINGSTAWINLGFMNFQPSEMAKVAFVLSVAWHLRRRDHHRRLRGLLMPFAIMFVPVLLILKEPDLGTALLFPPTLMIMLVAAGARLRHLGALVLVAVTVIGVNVALVLWAPESMQVLKPHQRVRIEAMRDQITGDREFVKTIGYQQDKAMTLVSAGGVSGMGDRAAVVIQHNKLPYDHNDMIFAVIANRWGLLGVAALLGLYVLLVSSMLWVAANSNHAFARLSCVGFGGMIFSQATINIGMCLGLLPITGITLPLVSYGGSSMLFTMVMVGLVLNFASRPRRPMVRPSFEFDGNAERRIMRTSPMGR